MYRTLLIICLLLSLTACHDKGRVVEPKPGPAHLMLLKTEYNFGIVTDKQATVVREIPLINDGSEVEFFVTDTGSGEGYTRRF